MLKSSYAKLIRVRAVQCSLLLFFISLPAKANHHVFRFLDGNGKIVISQSISKIQIQRGYDILDRRSLRIIKSFPPALTNNQFAEQEQAAIQKKQKEKRLISLQEQEKAKQKNIVAQKIIDIYGSKEALIQQRDIDLAHRQTQIDKTMLLLKRSEDNYRMLQNKLKEQQLINDQKIISSLQKTLQAVMRERKAHQYAISQLKAATIKVKKEYESSLLKLEEAP